MLGSGLKLLDDSTHEAAQPGFGPVGQVDAAQGSPRRDWELWVVVQFA